MHNSPGQMEIIKCFAHSANCRFFVLKVFRFKIFEKIESTSSWLVHKLNVNKFLNFLRKVSL